MKLKSGKYNQAGHMCRLTQKKQRGGLQTQSAAPLVKKIYTGKLFGE